MIEIVERETGTTIGTCVGLATGGLCPQAREDAVAFCAGHVLVLRDGRNTAARWRLEVTPDARTCPYWAAGA